MDGEKGRECSVVGRLQVVATSEETALGSAGESSTRAHDDSEMEVEVHQGGGEGMDESSESSDDEAELDVEGGAEEPGTNHTESSGESEGGPALGELSNDGELEPLVVDSDRVPDPQPEMEQHKTVNGGGAQNAQSDRQLAAFSSEKDFQASMSHLHRIPLAELAQDADLSNGYMGGKVVAQCMAQGGLEVVVTDDSLAALQKHITCYIQSDIAKQFPRCINADYRLYLHRVKVAHMFIEYSQDFEQCVTVSGSEPQLWIVHKDANHPDFLPGRKTKRNRKKKWKRKKTNQQAAAGQEGTSGGAEGAVRPMEVDDQGPATSTGGGTSNQADKQPSDVPGPSGHNQGSGAGQPSSSDTTHTSTFPDNFDIPDSALRDFHTFQGEPTEEDSSSSSCYSMSSETESTSEETEDEWQPLSKKPKVGKTGQEYEYKRLADLSPGERQVNVFGVVAEFKPSFATRGRDHCSFVKLIDESFPDPDAGLKCVLFHQNPNKLPHIRNVGDIINFHRVNINENSGVPSVEGTQYTSYLCFEGKPRSSMKPRTGSVSYTFTSGDMKRVRELRTWATEQAKNNSARKLESVTPNCQFDLPCQVVAITSCMPQCCATVLTVWDGTKLPLKNKRLNISQYSSRGDPSLQHAAGSFAENVVLYDSHCIKAAKSLSPGQYICLQKVRASVLCEASQNILELCIPKNSPKSGVVVTPPESDPELSELKGKLDEVRRRVLPSGHAGAVSHKQTSNINQAPVTTTPHQNIRFTPLCNVHSWKAAPSKFRCKVKMLGLSPLSVEEMVQLRCMECGYTTEMPRDYTPNTPCPKCERPELSTNEPPKLICTYLFKLLLEDNSGRITVYAPSEEAIKFLPGIPPTNMYRDQKMRYKLLERFYYLTGGNNPFESKGATLPRPWVECCFMSYKSPRENFPDRVAYRIFDTVLNSPNHSSV